MPNKDTPKYYEEIFNHSGESYHRAMQLFPRARDEEFLSILACTEFQSNSKVVDVPAGGGYLKRLLPNNIDYRGFDFSQNFSGFGPSVTKCQETSLQLARESVDTVICLAALHHVEDKLGFFQELNRILKKGGQLIIADVVCGSAQDGFLNQFVNQWNSIGHVGEFIDYSRDQATLKQANFSSTFDLQNFNWVFDSKDDAVEFCRLLFSLDLTPSDEQMNVAMKSIGVSQKPGSYQLNWQLGIIKARKIAF